MGKLNIMWWYVILSYGLFWFLVLALCGTASMVFKAPPYVMRILSDITAWSPTFAVLILYKKLKPNTKFMNFLKGCFNGKLKLSLFLLSGFIMLGGTAATVAIVSFIEKKSFMDYFSLGEYTFIASFFLSLFSGPTGEELGWRGYLRPVMNRKYGFLKGSIIQGIVWAFWHTLLWFIDSEFLDWRIIIYVISNVVVITSIALIMSIFLEMEENLLYSIWIHFCFNLPYSFLNVGISYYAVMCFVFPVLAYILYLYYHEASYLTMKDGKKIYYKDNKKDGQIILFCHGLKSSSSKVKKFINEFKEDYRMICFDQRNLDNSDQEAATEMNLKILGQDIHDIIEQLKLRDIIIMGYSTGSTSIISYVNQFDCEQLQKMVMIDMCPFIGNTIWESDLTQVKYMNDGSENDVDKIFDSDQRSAINKITVPLLYIKPEISNCSTVAVDYIKNNVKDKFILEDDFSGTTHSILMEKTKEVAECIKHFIQN